MIFFSLSCSTIRAETVAPDTSGVPTCIAPSATVSNTSEKVKSLPLSPGSDSTRSNSPGETRYCFPPVRMTAYDILSTYVSKSALSIPDEDAAEHRKKRDMSTPTRRVLVAPYLESGPVVHLLR